MIDLIYQNSNKDVFVFNADDWEVLRKEHRIIGELAGNTSFLPTLPLRLLPEEVYLLLNKNIARLICVKSKKIENQEEDVLKKTREDFDEKLLNSLKKLYEEERRKQLELYIDKIVKAKHDKGDKRDKEEIFKEELDKFMSSINKDNMIYPINLQEQEFNDCNKEEVVLSKLNDDNKEEVVLSKLNDDNKEQVVLSKLNVDLEQCKIFQDLWEKGFYVTSGSKFGGDYLLYEGDPTLHHALYIVRCVNNQNKEFHPTEITAYGRLANCVKKKAIFAKYNPISNKVNYLSLSWSRV